MAPNTKIAFAKKEEETLGAADRDYDAEFPALVELEAQMGKMELEQKKNVVLPTEVEGTVSTPESSTATTTERKYLTAEERAEIDSRSVFVQNVDYAVTKEELEVYFQHCGVVKRVTIPLDSFSGRPKGFAFVEFADKKSVQNALGLTGCVLNGRQIRVSVKRTNVHGISSTDRKPRIRHGDAIVKNICPTMPNAII